MRKHAAFFDLLQNLSFNIFWGDMFLNPVDVITLFCIEDNLCKKNIILSTV